MKEGVVGKIGEIRYFTLKCKLFVEFGGRQGSGFRVLADHCTLALTLKAGTTGADVHVD